MEYTVNDLAVKCKSKVEVYNVLSREGNIYLPPLAEATQKYLRSILKGHKKYITCNEVKVIKVPQYKGLRVKELVEFATNKVDIFDYLPDFNYKREPNREWLCNLINTLIPEEFKVLIDEKVYERRWNIIRSQNLGSNIRPEFINIFKKSEAISLKNGKSHFLVRDPKKTKLQIKYEKLEEEKYETEAKLENCTESINELTTKIKDLEKAQRESASHAEKLQNLFELGVINSEGQPINNDMN